MFVMVSVVVVMAIRVPVPMAAIPVTVIIVVIDRCRSIVPCGGINNDRRRRRKIGAYHREPQINPYAEMGA
jgi:hypothetical protein